MSGTLHYLNTDFDLSLRPRPEKSAEPAMVRMSDSLTVHALFAVAPGDALLVRVGIPDEYFSYLERLGIDAPALSRFGENGEDMELCPFGWSAEAIKLNSSRRNPVRHPPLSVVEKVNSRRFSSSLEAEHFGVKDRGAVLRSSEELCRWLASCEGEGEEAGGWVVKSDHGNAGLGNKRIRRRKLEGKERRFVDGLFAEDDIVTVEPWRQRLLDLSVVFALSPSGEVSGLRVHETVTTADGGFIGALFCNERFGCEEELGGVAAAIAGELSREGYFGPVCFDAFLYGQGGESVLRKLVDLNCRRAVSDAVSRLRDKAAGDGALYWRFYGGGKLDLPSCETLLRDEGHWRSDGGRGFLLTSPAEIIVEGSAVRGPKTGVAFFGSDRDDVLALEGAFRARFER